VLVDEEHLHFVVLHRVFQGRDEQVADVRFDVGHSQESQVELHCNLKSVISQTDLEQLDELLVLDPGQVCSEEVFDIILSTVHLKYHEDLFLFDEEAFPVVHGNSSLYRVINEDLFIEGLCILANGLRL